MPRIRLPHAAAALAAGLWAGLTPMQAPAQSAETNRDNVMIVFDGSNSMWGQIDGVAKIEIARGVMANLLGGWTDGRSVGLMAYGHRRRGDCTDIETLIEPAPGTRAAILDRIGAITPTGKTPLTDAVEQAARELSYTDRPATVILISDGLESCERDPCALAEVLERGGVGFTAHVVGFGLGADEDSASLACIAERTGGQYIQAGNAEELGRALSAVGDAVAQAPVAEPVKAPEPEPEPALPQITLTGPDTALTGQRVDIGWAGTTAAEDYITVVPAGAAEGAFTNYVHVRQDSRNQLRMPAQPGLYELRYMVDKGGRTAAARPIEIQTPEITLTGPDSAMTGSEIPVGWTGAVDAEDYVTVVAMGAVEGSHGSYANVRGDSQAMLQAPAEPGMYELRYVLGEGARTMASRPIEITEPQVALTGPDSAQAGSKITVGWTGTVNGQDYITIVPMGAEEGSSGNYRRVRDQQSEELQAPAEPGMYELRYVLEEGRRTMASRPIEITEPQVTVSGPESAQAGSKFAVSWTGAVSGEDYVTIVPMGAEDGSYTSYRRVRDLDSEQLQAPADPGMYELRYVLEEGGRTMARQPIEITEPKVAVTGPETAAAGSKISVSWTGAVSGEDYVTVVPMGAAEGSYTSYRRVRDLNSEKLQMPAEPGMYELRYVLEEGGRTMASQPIEITEPQVTVSGPDQVRAGDRIKVSWTGAVDGEDYITLVPAGTPEGTHDEYFRVRAASSGEIAAPETPGMYELRYMLEEGGRVLATHPVEVLEKTAALNSGASLTAPETAAPGTTIEVGWNVEATSADQRVTLARADQAIFTWIEAVRTQDGPPVQIKLPDLAGEYELRFLDVTNRAVLARKPIRVE